MCDLGQRRSSKAGLLVGLLAAAVLGLVDAARAQVTPEDPAVRALDLVLRRITRNADLRRTEIQKKAEGLHTLTQLGAALQLPEWGISPLIQPEAAQVDIEEWNRLARRFIGRARAVLESSDPLVVRAGADLVAEIAAREQKKQEYQSTTGLRPAMGRELDLLARMSEDLKGVLANRISVPQTQARVAVARALASLPAEPQTVRKALSPLLTDADAAVRRGGCEALALYIQTQVGIDKYGGGLGDRAGISEAVAMIVAMVRPDLDDADAQVRLRAVQVERDAARALNDMIRPVSTDLSPDDRAAVEEYARSVKEEYRQLTPLMEALRHRFDTLARLANSPDGDISLAAREAFDALATAREKLQERRQSIPPTPRTKPDADINKDAEQGQAPPDGAEPGLLRLVQKDEPLPPPRPVDDILTLGFTPILPAIAAGLQSPDLTIRLKTANTLEMLGAAAATPEVIATLIKAQHDPSVFVRWASARVLGKMAAGIRNESQTVVTALAEQLSTPDIDYRKALAVALGAYEARAAAAIPQLARAATSGDSDARLAAVQALRAIGPRSIEALPTLIAALKTETVILRGSDTPRVDDAKVRQAAAELLGYLGPAAVEAVPALRAALQDPTPAVRTAAADALVSILAPEK
jgi:hypothetical protein